MCSVSVCDNFDAEISTKSSLIINRRTKHFCFFDCELLFYCVYCKKTNKK